jgi:1,4-alpha-glucan branching enzyme
VVNRIKIENLANFSFSSVSKCVAVHVAGKKGWKEIFNSDAKKYGGAGDLTNTSIVLHPQDEKGEWNQLLLNLPALSAIVLA